MCKPLDALLGFGEADITPEDFGQCELVGFNRPDNLAKGILDRLKAQVLLLENEQQSCCLITVDSIGFTMGLTDQLRDQAAKKIGTKREHIMVCYSHTHSAPDAAADNGKYYHFACDRILQAVALACENLSPVKAAWGIADNNIAVNRRAEAETIDKRIGILKFTAADTDEMKLLLLRVTAHPNVLTSDNFLISADYIGKTRELLEKEYGCNVMLTQGAAGNIKARYRQHNADMLEERSLEAAAMDIDEKMKREIFNESIIALEKNASEIARAVAAVVPGIVPASIDRFMMFSDTQTFCADVPAAERAQEIALEAKAYADIDGTEWQNEVNRLIEKKVKYQETVKEIQFFIVNEGGLCGIPDEPMCEIALDIQKRAADDFIFFGGYTNGYAGYLPCGEEYDNGGYEVLWSNLLLFKHYGRVMPLNRDTAVKLADNAARIWKQLKSEYRKD